MCVVRGAPPSVIITAVLLEPHRSRRVLSVAAAADFITKSERGLDLDPLLLGKNSESVGGMSKVKEIQVAVVMRITSKTQVLLLYAVTRRSQESV